MGKHIKEKCGIFGVVGGGFEAARLIHPGLWALQHRGQESSGIASSDGKKVYVHKGMGLVAHVFSEENLRFLKGHMAIGHNRYSTSGASISKHAQPVVEKINGKGLLALVHNGNLPSAKKLEEFLKSRKISFSGLNDSEMMTKAIAYFISSGLSLEDAVKKAYPLFSGVFCLLIMDKSKVVALRDAFGIRPLCLGQLNRGYVVASESCALDIIGAKFVRDVRPGEMIVLDESGLKSIQLEKGQSKLDVFEFVYFARPDSYLLGKSVDEVRQNLGEQLAKENKIEADIVIPVPDSAIPAALGFSRASGIPFYPGLIKNRYIHRTFIMPEEHTRNVGVRLKLNPMKHILKGKRVAVVDDSIVRGTTSKELIKMIKSAGAKEVHLLISSPPVKYPDFYGIDTPRQVDLIASKKPVKEIEKEIGADSLHYLSYQGLLKAVGIPEDNLCTSCFTGIYPVDIGERARQIKKVG
ncbi:amidophosphoribosyltransferase [Candidatus Microgenomates bacterium]|nr:amidophosphoribosyltransferase [Candidatus Microgenomates bacterium]